VFEGFTAFRIKTSGAEIDGLRGGEGPPLLLLHGYPQTRAIWHKLAVDLARHFTVIAADLRGYGASSKPPGGPDHAGYSKRAMAQDMVEVMAALGFDRFAVCGHDRGGRVAHRMALDHEDRVTRLAVLDIAPTREMYRDTGETLARKYWHWFWLTLPEPFPERSILADPAAYLRLKCGSWGTGADIFASEAWAEYEAAIADPATVHAMCEDYRAAATIDIAHDDADRGRKVAQPLLALWGEDGVIAECFDCLALWRERAADVRGKALPGGHYIPEQHPEALLPELLSFFAEGAA
jgi:haloacetate dehalogenase